MKKLAIRVGLAILGMAATLTWWTLHPGDSHTERASSIPSSVWGGGTTNITVEAESSSPATMRISFSDHSKPAAEQRSLETWEKMGSQPQTWTVNVPGKVGGYIELGADHPKAGDWLRWKVTIDGQVVNEDKQVLDKDLEPNTAFFLQVFYDDYSKAGQELGEGSDQ